MRNDICARLRKETAKAHLALEDSDYILPATRDAARYAGLIGAMFGFHVALERELRRFHPLLEARGIAMADRYRAHVLRLEACDLASPAYAVPALRFTSAAQAAGGVYVAEGATLGGALIGRSVREHLGRESRFYGMYGSATAHRWRRTQAQLEAFVRESEDLQHMIDGAITTFETLHRHLAATLGLSPAAQR